MRFASELVLAMAVLAVAGCKDEASDPAPDDGAGDETGGAEGGTQTGETGGDSGESGGESGEGSGDSGDPIDEGPWESFAERPCPPDSFLTYENFGWPHMLSFCTGCHSSMLPADMRQMAPIEVNFDSVEDVREQAERIWARSGDQHDTMPPVGAAAEDERYLLGEWLACGAPTDDDLAD